MAGVALPSLLLALLFMMIATADEAAQWASTLIYVFLDVVIAAGCGVCVGSAFMWLAMRRERRAGYTTLNLSGWRFNGFLWQLDHRTGQVLRRPGDKEVPIKELRRMKSAGGRYTDAELMAAVMGKPGWYPDYRNHGVMTWWDGTDWTEHTA